MVNFLSSETEPIGTFKEGDPKGAAPGGYNAWFKPENQPTEYPEVEEVIETGIAKRDPFDAGHLVALFKDFHGEIDKMANKSMGLMVMDDQSLELATVFTTQAKALAQAVEKQRIEVKAPYLKVTAILDGETKGLKDRLLQIQGHLNGKITPFLQKKEAERKEKERLAAAEAAKIQADLDKKAEEARQKAAEEAKAAALAAGMSKKKAEQEAQAAAALVEDAPIFVAQVVEETKVQTETGSAKLKEEWTFEIIDIRGMPNEAFENRKAEVIKALSPWVNNQVKAGARNIPGVKIFKSAKVQTRVSRGAA